MGGWTEFPRNHGETARHYETTPCNVVHGLKRKAFESSVLCLKAITKCCLCDTAEDSSKRKFKSEFFIIIFFLSILFLPCTCVPLGGVFSLVHWGTYDFFGSVNWNLTKLKTRWSFEVNDTKESNITCKPNVWQLVTISYFVFSLGVIRSVFYRNV